MTTFLLINGLGLSVAQAAESGIPIADLNRSEPVNFEKEIRPLLKESCLACHNETSAKAGLVLESPKTIRAGTEDGSIVVPFKSDQSLLLKVASHQKEPFMPPEDNEANAEPLSSQELGLLKLWIDQGAKVKKASQQKSETIDWQPLPPGINPIYSLSMTSDGQYVACGRANQVFIYDLPARRLFDRLTDRKLLQESAYSKRGVAHRDLVQSLQFSPGGRFLASGGFRTMKLWERGQNRRRQELTAAQGAEVRSIAVSENGGWLAAGLETGAINLWRWPEVTQVRRLKRCQKAVTDLVFTEDGQYLVSCSLDRRLLIWKLSNGALVGRIVGPAPMTAVAFANNESQVAAAGKDGLVRLWKFPFNPRDLKLPKPAQLLESGQAEITALAPLDGNGGRLISANREGKLSLWDVGDDKPVRSMDSGKPVTALAVGAAGRRVAALEEGGTVQLWNPKQGQRLTTLSGDHRLKRKIDRRRRQIVVEESRLKLREEKLAAARQEWEEHIDVAAKAAKKIVKAQQNLEKKTEAVAEAKEEDKEKAEELAKAKKAIIKTVQRSEFKIEAAREFADAYLKAQSSMETAQKRLETAKAKLTKAKEAYDASKVSMHSIAALEGSDRIATVNERGLMQTWSFEAGDPISAIETGLSNSVSVAGFNKGGALVTGNSKGLLTIWDSEPQWKLTRTLGHSSNPTQIAGRVTAIDFSPNGELVAVGSGQPSRKGQLKIWNTGSGKLVREVSRPHGDMVLSVAFSPDGDYLATGGADRLVKVFQVKDGALVNEFQGHGHHILDVAWRADGTVLASASADHVIKLWNVREGEHIKNIEGFDKEVTSVEFLGLDDQLLATSGDGILQIGDERISQKERFIYDAAIDFNRTTLVSGGQDSVLRVWEVASGELIHRFLPPTETDSQEAVQLAN